MYVYTYIYLCTCNTYTYKYTYKCIYIYIYIYMRILYSDFHKPNSPHHTNIYIFKYIKTLLLYRYAHTLYPYQTHTTHNQIHVYSCICMFTYIYAYIDMRKPNTHTRHTGHTKQQFFIRVYLVYACVLHALVGVVYICVRLRVYVCIRMSMRACVCVGAYCVKRDCKLKYELISDHLSQRCFKNVHCLSPLTFQRICRLVLRVVVCALKSVLSKRWRDHTSSHVLSKEPYVPSKEPA